MQIESGALPLDLNRKLRCVPSVQPLVRVRSRTAFMAGLIGLAILFAFILIYYRLPGLTACMALCGIYLLCNVASWQRSGCTADAPGYSRASYLVSEWRSMRTSSYSSAFKGRIPDRENLGLPSTGFQKAFVTILDSNVTTLICAIVLAVFGTGTLKSFAYVDYQYRRIDDIGACHHARDS